MSTATLETALRWLLHARNRHDNLRAEARALAHHDVSLLRAMRVPQPAHQQGATQ